MQRVRCEFCGTDFDVDDNLAGRKYCPLPRDCRYQARLKRMRDARAERRRAKFYDECFAIQGLPASLQDELYEVYCARGKWWSGRDLVNKMYWFAHKTIRVIDDLRGYKRQVVVDDLTVDDFSIEQLERLLDGLCPSCFQEVPDGSKVCCSCLAHVVSYHREHHVCEQQERV